MKRSLSLDTFNYNKYRDKVDNLVDKSSLNLSKKSEIVGITNALLKNPTVKLLLNAK